VTKLYLVKPKPKSRSYRAGFVLGESLVWIVAVGMLAFLVHLLW
jgi:hypothetical protein